MSRRRGDSDDEGAAPPVNRRCGMGGSNASHHDYSVNGTESPRSSFTPRSTTGPTWMSPPNQQQQSASTHSAGAHLQQQQLQMQSQMPMVNSHSTHGYNNNNNNNNSVDSTDGTDRRNSTSSNGYHHNYHGGSSNNNGSHNNMILRASTSSSSSRYLTRSTKLPSRWVLDPQDRALMSVTSLDRTNLRLNHGPAGDTSHVTALPPSSAPTTTTTATTPSSNASAEAKGRCVVIVSNHSIPLDHLKEVALKNGMNRGLHQNGGAGDYGSLLSDDPLAEASGGSTIDQILSNLRTKTTFTTSTSTSGIHGRTTNRRATSASLYPSLPGERGGSSMAAGGTGGNSVIGNASLSISSHEDRRFSTGNPTGIGVCVNASSASISPHAGGTTPRKATSSPVYYFEVMIQALPADATVSIGMVVTDGPAVSTDDPFNKPVIPGYIKQSIGLTSKGDLKVNGRSVEEKKFALDGGEFQVGDVIGCGLEVVGTRRVFFTRNGKTVIPPTRFHDVEPKCFAYSPSVGIATSGSAKNDANNSGGVSVYANFGGKSGRAFQWEEADVSHIVNSGSAGQHDQKQPPGVGYDGSGRSSGRNGDAAKGQPSSHSLSPLRQTEYLEQRSAPPSQLYNFGKPSSQGELMSSLDNLPLATDDCDNDASIPTNGAAHSPANKASTIDFSAASAAKGPLAASAPTVKSPPSQGTQQSTEDLKVTPAAPARKSSGRSKSPRGLFSFGKSSKRSSQGASTPDRNSSLGSTSSQKKPSSRSASPAFFGLRSKKKGGGDLLDEDEDEDENDFAQVESDFQKMATAAVQEMPSSSRQAPVDKAITGASQNADGIPSTTPPPQSSNSLFGKKSRKNSLDDENPSDIQLQSQVSNTITPPNTQAQTSGGVGGNTYLTAQSSGNGTQTLFGKKSKKSSLDDDNPADVQLQTTISNDFPLDIARMPSGPNGTSSGIVPSGSGSQNAPESATPMIFGKKSRRGTLEDDDVDDHVQTNFANLPSDYGLASGVASLPASDTKSNAVVFGCKSKKSSLEDDDPDDNQYQTHAQWTFGSKSKKKSLEDDDPDDDKYESHSSLTGTGVHSGAPIKNGSLEDDVTDRKYAAHASLTPAIGGSTGIALGIPDGSQYSSVSLPVSNPMAGHNSKPASTPHAYSSDGAKNSQQEDGASDGLSGFRSSFGLPSKKGSLEDDDPNDSSYQSHSLMPGSVKKRNSLEDDEPIVTRYQNSAQKQESVTGLPNVNPFAPRSSMTPGKPARGSPERHRQNMMRSAPIGASTGNASMPVSFDSPISTSIAAHTNRDNSGIDQVPSVPQSSNRESAASSSSHAPEGASEDDMLKAAIEASKNDQKKEELQSQAGDTGASLRDPKEIEAIRDNARTLRMSSADEGVDASVLQSLLEICRADQAKIQACLQSEDPPVDFMEMLALNELVVDDIKMGQKMIEGMKKKAPASTAAAAVVTSSKSSKTNLNLDIGALVEKKDIFSLICILRAQSDQRLDAALALMNFAREADSLAEAGGRSLRDEIRSSGGMHSLITVFRSKGASYELRVVSALAVAYVLPSFVESSSVHPSVGLKIMECLRFLSTSRLVSPNGRRISQEEMYRASAAGVTTFWINELTPMLNSGAGAPKNDSTAERSDLFSRTNKKGRRRGRTGGQRHQTLELQELLEMTVSLIVQIERLGENEALKKNHSAQTDSLFLWRYTNVEQVCAVDVARPIAVREGLLPILVGWIRSKDREKVRPAVSALRYLTSIKDKYMAGWIHSQMVNEGALSEVVKLADDYYVGQDVRLAVAQILASLCVAPHTRAAVVEAKCINYLIGFLYDHSDKASQDVALFAGSAILQLAEGAITRASVLGGGDAELQDGASPDKSDTLVDDIVNSGAIGSFIAIALNHEGKLRSMAIEAIRVLSEDTSPNRRTRSQLCEECAAMSLGRALKDDVTDLHSAISSSNGRVNAGANQNLDELHDALCALANILEPIQPGNNAATKLRFVSSISDPTENLIQGCIETSESGGLDSLLWISSLPLTGTAVSDSTESTVQRIDLLEEACRSLASLSPLLLSKEPAAQGYANSADSIFEAFDRILMLDSIEADNNSIASEYNYEQEAMLELNISALRGLGALATAEPLKIKIVDKTLPCLLQMRNSQSNGSDISNVAGQVFLSLGFEEDEIAVQVAGSNPSLLADWFCLQRSLIIQAMARSEVRGMLQHIWKTAFAETNRETVTRLIRESNVRRTGENKVSVDSFAESFAEIDLFESFADDDYTEQLRFTMVRQYHEFYNMGKPTRTALGQMEGKQDEVSLLARHMYPLSDTQTEIDWMLSHDESQYSKPIAESSICTNVSAPGHVEALLDCCFPSRLLRNHIVPVFNLRPEATFNFRALTLPQRKYFSFRREGQLIARLCDKQAETLDFDDVHWTLGFMNCTFAGEFSETFVQALYLCPTIRGLSFGKNEDYTHLRALDGDDDRGEDGRASLANLVGSLPPWIQSLTFSNIFSDSEVKTIVGIIETMGKLSSDQAVKASSMGGYSSRGRDTSSAAQTQGKFWSFALSSSPGVSPDVWYSFFGLLGKGDSLPIQAVSTPLSTLKVLDLSFNNLGDETCSLLLELIHDPESGCSLEQLDLSGNAIRAGERVLDVFSRYVDNHRFNIAADGKVDRNGWMSTLHTLNLSANNLGMGKAAVGIVSLLKHNALGFKLLDLSSNSLDHSNVEYELTQEILSFIELNDMLCHLNLSNNSLSPHVLDDMLGQLAGYENISDCGLAFLGLDNNTPPLTTEQTECLEEFLQKSRRGVLQRCLTDRDSVMSGELLQPNMPTSDYNGLGYQKASDLSVIGESTVLKNQESDFTKFDDPEGQPGDNMITVLFSAPLVFTNERRQLKPFAKLDFDMERELMWQCMKEASRDIELFFDNATHDRLLAAITKRCSCLHYSGHGHPSYLPFEDGGGGPNWFKVEDIQRLIAREGAAPFKFVFVSACHSGLAGETFASAGVPHVVCCQQEFELKDTAALAFTRQFYLSLVVGHTVRESFEQGCKAVRATPNLRDAEKEMKKFLLLPKDGNHDVPIFNAKAVVEWPKVDGRQLKMSRSKRSKSITRIRNLHAGGARSSELGVRNMMQEDPSPTPPQFFLGREVSMYYVLKAILCKRLVSVVAEPGCGRSSLVCALCHYINERASTIIAIERIYFVKAKRSRRVDGCRALMEQLLRKLVESGKEDPPDPGVDMEDLFDFICKALKNEKALVVFDRMEYLENSDDAEEFPMLLSTLFRGTKNVKVLVTGRRQLGIPSLGGQVEYPYPLGPLSFENTLRLFANLCPHLHTAGERHKLFERLATDGEQSELHPADSGISERTKAIFKTIGDGIPSRIEQAAYDISSDGLGNLLERYG